MHRGIFTDVMPGPIRTLTRAFQPVDVNQGHAEVFSTFVQYFDSHPGFDRIASKYGTNGGGLKAPLFFSGSSGEQAFAIYRAMSSSITYDLSFVWSYNNNYSANTWTGAQTYGFGVMMAFHSSSAAWSGSVNNNGSDAFFTNSKPWKAGSVVFPRGNNSGGTWATNMNAPLKAISSGIQYDELWQMTIIGDNETTYAFLQTADQAVIGDARHLMLFGTYLPLTSAYNLPLVMLAASAMDPTADFGSTTDDGLASNQNGAISYVSGTGSKICRISFLQNAARRPPRPAEIIYSSIGGNTHAYKFPVVLRSYEASHYHQLGVLSGVFAVAASAFGNIQDVSRSMVTMKINNAVNSRNLSFAFPFSGSTDFFLRGTFE